MKRTLLLLSIVLIAMPVAAADAERRSYSRNVAIVIYPNVQPLDWTGPYEVYNDAGRFAANGGEPAFNVYTVSKSDAILDGQGLAIKPTYSIRNAPRPDIVVFPGGPASREINEDPEFFAWAKKVATEAEIAQSVCTGAFVLGKAGLLDGLEVTTFYGAIDSLRESFPNARVSDGRRYIDNGKVVTTAGISAGIDGSLHVVARLLGRRVADQTARYMEYHWTPESYLARAYQYLNPSVDERGRLVQKAGMALEEKNPAEAERLYRLAVAENANDSTAWNALGGFLHTAKRYEEAAAAYVASSRVAKGSDLLRAYYDAACGFAQAGKLDQAAEYLKKAYEAGLKDRNVIETDPDLAPLRSHPVAAALASAKK